MSQEKTLADTSIPDPFRIHPDPFAKITDDDLIIFPTALLSDHFKKQLIGKNIPYNPDRITTLHGFCRKYHEEHGKKTRIISDGQALLILSHTLEQIRGDIPFFFNQGNPSSGTIKDLYSLRSIISQRSIDFASHSLVRTSEKCRQISHALVAYEETLADNQLLDLPALIEWTTQDISAKTGSLFACVTIHRLFEIFPREETLILAIRAHAEKFRFQFLAGKDPEIFVHPDWLKPEELVLIEPTEEFISRSDIFRNTSDTNQDGLIQTNVFASTTGEFESIAEEIHALAEDGTPLEDIVITFPKISSIVSSLQEVLHDFGIPSHSYVGEPLIREPIIGFLLLFLSLVADAYPRESVIHLISSPYFNIRQTNLPRITASEFDLGVRTAGIERGYSWEESLRALKNLPEDAIQSFPRIPPDSIDAIISWIAEIQKDCNQFKGTLTPAGYAAIFQELCKKWMQPEFRFFQTKSDDPILLREIQAYHLFWECLTRLSSLLDTRETVNLSQFRRFLICLLEEPVNLSLDSGGVRIMGLRQIVGMEYTCLFLGGLVEGDIPYPSTRIPLLTSPESEQLGSRGLDEVIRGEQYYFISTLAAGKKVWLSASKTRGERKILTSSFLERVKKGKNPPEWGRDILHSQKRASIRAGKSIAKRAGSTGNCPVDSLTFLPSEQTYGVIATRILIEDWFRTGTQNTVYDGILTDNDEVITWLSDDRMFGPERIWSPTQLETYANCPFRFFLDRVVKVSPLPEVDPTLSPAQRGSLIHETLCTFYSRWCGDDHPRRITWQDLNEGSELLLQIGKEKSGNYKFQSPVWHATVASLQGFDGVPGLYERLLYHEAGSETTLRPDKFEFKIRCSLNSPDSEPGYVILDPGEGEPVKIHGRIDRVDTTPDGHFAIIDYKTGSQYPNGKRIVEGKALQLPLYLLALEKMHENDDKPKVGIGGSYLEISRKISQTWPLLNPEMKHVAGVPRARGTADFRQVTMGALTAAQRYITDIRNGLFPVTRDTCSISKYCPYSGICRLDRFRVTDTADEGAE